MSGRTKFETLKARMLADPAVRAEYDALEAEFTTALALIAARSAANLTQQTVASRMQTKQETVACLPEGQSKISTFAEIGNGPG